MTMGAEAEPATEWGLLGDQDQASTHEVLWSRQVHPEQEAALTRRLHRFGLDASMVRSGLQYDMHMDMATTGGP